MLPTDRTVADPGRLAEVVTLPARRTPPMMADRALEHQIVLRRQGSGIAVSCNCLRRPGGSFQPLEVREMWQGGQAAAVWRAHLTS
jgi:hypothetical protein